MHACRITPLLVQQRSAQPLLHPYMCGPLPSLQAGGVPIWAGHPKLPVPTRVVTFLLLPACLPLLFLQAGSVPPGQGTPNQEEIRKWLEKNMDPPLPAPRQQGQQE